uniref:Uncharacterized protein n=1 Tax=Setaria digitata TaxID=48799 RepID=A0A915PW25_9BILA
MDNMRLKKQDDEGELTEFEEIEVVRRPAHSRMRNKLKWKQGLEPTKMDATTVVASDATSTTSSSVSSSSVPLKLDPFVLNADEDKTEVLVDNENEQKLGKGLKKQNEVKRREKRGRKSVRKTSTRQIKQLKVKSSRKSAKSEKERKMSEPQECKVDEEMEKTVETNTEYNEDQKDDRTECNEEINVQDPKKQKMKKQDGMVDSNSETLQ